MRQSRKIASFLPFVFLPALAGCATQVDPAPSGNKLPAPLSGVQPKEINDHNAYLGCDVNVDPECSGTVYDNIGGGGGGGGGGGFDDCAQQCFRDFCDQYTNPTLIMMCTERYYQTCTNPNLCGNPGT